MKRIFLGLFILLMSQACSEKLTDSISNTKWVLSDWPGKTLPTEKKASLMFDSQGKISGKSFCNGFGGNAIIKGNELKMEQIFGTMMFCEDVGQAEKNYLDGLKATTSFTITNGKLQLFADKQLLMVFTKGE